MVGQNDKYSKIWSPGASCFIVVLFWHLKVFQNFVGVILIIRGAACKPAPCAMLG